MKVVTRVLLVALLLAILAGGGYWFYQNRITSTATAAGAVANAEDGFTQVVSVEQGDLSASISVVGELYAVQQEDLRFDRLNGTDTLLTLEVTAGNVIQQGQVLATIDPSPYQQALDQAESDLQEAEERLADLQEPATELEIAQADLAIAKAELALQQAESDLDALLAPDIADLEVDVANARVALAEAQADLLALQVDSAFEDKLYTLREREADKYGEYDRLSKENYSDAYYQDRLLAARNAFMDAQDTRVNTELQRQVDILKAQMAVRKAERQLADAQEALADAQAGGDELDLAEARQAVAQAEADLASAQEEREALDQGPDSVDLAAARADVDKKRLAVSEAELDLAGATLRAPFDGTVLQTYAEPGDRISSNSKILTLANLDRLEVLASVDETTIRQVAAGQPAEVTFDAFPGQTFSGQVVSVPLQGALQGGVMVYQVPISLEGAEDLPLRVGMTANVEIKVGEVENALLVPTMALQNVGGLYQVLVPASNPSGTPIAVPVEVGLSDGVYTQVVRGLNAGDQVVMQIAATDTGQFDFRAMRQMMEGGPRRRD